MSASTAEDLYDTVRRLPVAERLRLVEKIAHDLSAEPLPAEQAAPAFDWSMLAGAAPGLLGGEDAQAWVSRSRREADDDRALPGERTP